MAERIIDLRSDTVTVPDSGMREAMAAAVVGDDVFEEDPTINELQQRVAAMLGKEDALFVPSGTMSNQIAIHAHTRPGDQLLCEENAHIYIYEGGGPAVLSGVTCRPIRGDRGLLTVEDFEDKINPSDVHKTRTRLVTIENTHNRGGGSIYPIEDIEAISNWARLHGLAMHLDGARLWNAIVATGIPAHRWGQAFDSISLCFSKGLGAPIGSVLVGTRDFILRARHVRKLLGGGMRQVGVLGAACLYALDHNLDRLAEDHANAKLLAEVLEACGLGIRAQDVETNMLWADVDPRFGTAAQVVERFAEHGILMLALGPQTLRAVTNLMVTTGDIHTVCEKAKLVLREI
jgi:threonine aldolase